METEQISDQEMDSNLIAMPEINESDIALNIKKPVSKVLYPIS